MLASVTHILPLTTIRRERRLPVAGRVLVRSGQKVKATDVVAEANLAPKHMLLNIARGLGMTPEAADQRIERKAGEEVVEGDVIANRGGLARRVVRAPVSGRIVMAGEGQVLIEAESQPFQVLAGIPGNIIQVMPDRGVVVQTTGALLQGVWGNGRVDFGVLNVVAPDPETALASDQFDVRMRGSIIMGGHCGDEETLRSAADLSLRGLIISSISARLLPYAARLRFPIVVLEGFGQRMMNPEIYQLFSTNDNREVVMNAERYSRLAGTRPEVIIPLPAPGQPGLPQDAAELTPGQKVRIIRAPHAGVNGVLTGIRPGLAVFPSGIRTPAGKVTLLDGENVLVPLANLEILE